MISLKQIKIPLIVIMVTTIIIYITVDYNRYKVQEHYHTVTCQVLNCSINENILCSNKNDKYKSCYGINIAYMFLDLDGQSYSKANVMQVYDPNFCNQRNITCYYDDESIYNSLQILYPYDVSWQILPLTRNIILRCYCGYTLLAVIIQVQAIN